MDFEPTNFEQFEPRIQTLFEPFEPFVSIRNGHLMIRHLISGIISALIVLYTNTARTTLWIVARAEMLVWKTASAHDIWSRRKGGSK